MTPRPGKAFRLSVLELERRDVPAWWTVDAPDPAAGTLGVTAATHAGQLALDPALVQADGTARVEADSAADAVALALTGTVRVTLSGQSVGYRFTPGAAGSEAPEHRPFLLTDNEDETVTVALEDMAGWAGSDWDYDDRSWAVTVEAAPVHGGGAQAFGAPPGGGGGGSGGDHGDHQAGSGTQADPWILDDLRTGETASAWLAVTTDPDGMTRWTYTVTNISLSTHEQTPGMYRFSLTNADSSQVEPQYMTSRRLNSNGTTSPLGWVSMAADGVIGWQTPDIAAGPYLTIGQTATFSFRTVSAAKIPGRSEVGMAPVVQPDDENPPPSHILLFPALRPLGKADVPVHTSVSITLPAEVPVNANNDNKSAWKSLVQPGIPSTRDFEVITPTTYEDGQLRPGTVVITGGAAGTLLLTDSTADSQFEGAGGSDVSFWTDKKKTQQANVVQIPASASGSYTFNFYVEGVHESSSPTDNSYVIAEFTQGAGTLAFAEGHILVTPVLRTMTATPGGPKVTFYGAGTPTDGGLGLTSQPYPIGNADRVPGIRFSTNVYGGTDFPDRGKFLQNVMAVTNGYNTPTHTGPGLTLVMPSQQKNEKLSDAATQAGGAFPLLDGRVDPTTGVVKISYPEVVSPTPNPDPDDQFAVDSPAMPLEPDDRTRVTRMDVLIEYRMFYLVRFSDGSLYALGHCDWSVNWYATSAGPNNPVLVNIPDEALVSTAGWVRSNDDPGKLVAPIANGSLYLQY